MSTRPRLNENTKNSQTPNEPKKQITSWFLFIGNKRRNSNKNVIHTGARCTIISDWSWSLGLCDCTYINCSQTTCTSPQSCSQFPFFPSSTNNLEHPFFHSFIPIPNFFPKAPQNRFPPAFSNFCRLTQCPLFTISLTNLYDRSMQKNACYI